MKKIISILIISALSLILFAGCNQIQNQDPSENTNTGKTAGKIGVKTVTVQNVQLQIPENYESRKGLLNESSDTVAYFYSEDSFLKIIHGGSDMTSLTDFIFQEHAVGLGQKFSDFETGETSDHTFGNETYKLMNVTFTFDNQSYNGYVAICNLATIILGTNGDLNNETQKGFEQILSTIQLSETAQPEMEYLGTSLDYIYLREALYWDMPPEEVAAVETKPLNEAQSTSEYLTYTLDYDNDRYADAAQCVYKFVDNQLMAYWCRFNESQISDYKGAYEEIRYKLSERYGTPDAELVNVPDSTYDDDIARWNESFRFGYISAESRWDTGNSIVIVKWSFDNGMIVITTMPGYDEYL